MIKSNLNSDLKLAFIAVCNTFKEFAWKAQHYSNGKKCFGGRYFIAGITTKEGSYTYMFPMKYWDSFKCHEVECTPNVSITDL